ncbi:peptidase M16 [Alkalihalophilus pseudofirmus]|uniref:EF-P 5-aminopentanol modification-associated protein YfmF n=1 Tax=Alkalihalobacterium alkalinitrilicum TaxID=427920 RepID=UPI00094DCB59|nr:pitrilysin family protein [Alkalihalobacterium alkalinitrilicum]OLO40952.1 peptidase M16 [Alkalihalophilus pseudofirmus]
MNQLQEIQSELNGLNLHMVNTPKYKTTTIVLFLKAPLEAKTVTKRALIPHILQSGTAHSPTRKEIRNRLDELYGASLSVDVQKKGEEHVIGFRMDIANEKFLKDSTPLFEKAVELLAEVLLQPKQENGQFATSIVESEKRSLKQRIKSVYDDKMRYANMRITEEMCKGEPFALSVHGEEKQIDEIKGDDLFAYYQQLLQEDKMDFYIVGDIDPDAVRTTIQQYFSLPEGRKNTGVTVQTTQKQVSEVKTIFDEQDVKQGKLHMGYRTYTTFKDDAYYALQVFNGLFGGFSHSKLFINVREKASLAYYAASRYESHKGIIMVMSGIEFENYDKAVSIINEQMENMQKGEFSDGELDQTKAMINNQLLETADTARGYAELLYHNVVANKERSLDEWIQGINRVTKEDVIAIANQIKLDTIYFLKGKEGTTA